MSNIVTRNWRDLIRPRGIHIEQETLTDFYGRFSCEPLAHPLEKIISGKRPVFPNGVGTAIIEGLVEILEIVSSYLSNSVSFLRVGAFALAHAVLGYIIFSIVAQHPE